MKVSIAMTLVQVSRYVGAMRVSTWQVRCPCGFAGDFDREADAVEVWESHRVVCWAEAR